MDAEELRSQPMGSFPVTELSAGGRFESHDILWKCFPYVKNRLLPSHPLELLETPNLTFYSCILYLLRNDKGKYVGYITQDGPGVNNCQ